MHIEVPSVEDVHSRHSYSDQRLAGRFADYVRLHGKGKKIIFIEQEHDLLKAGISEFGLSLSEASGVLHGAAEESGATLESQVERHLQTYLSEPRNRREARLAERGKPVNSNALPRKRFEQAVDFYQTLTRAALTRDEARKRVKAMVMRMGLKARRDWLRLGSSKWFNAIKNTV
jgi:hypothetical protein